MMGRRIVIPEALLPDPAKLELLIAFLDDYDAKVMTQELGREPKREAQEELQVWADNLRLYGVQDRYEPELNEDEND